MMEKIEEYADQIDESRSTATRQLIYDGLEHKESRRTVPAWMVAALLGWMFVAAAFLDVSTPIGLVGAGLVVLSTLEGRLGLLHQLT